MKRLIADLLQEADPVDAVGYTPAKTKVSYRDEVGQEWLRATAQPAPFPAALTIPKRATPAGPYKDKEAFITYEKEERNENGNPNQVKHNPRPGFLLPDNL
jgi:hypothetical protein